MRLDSVSRFRRFNSLRRSAAPLVAEVAIFFQKAMDDVFQLGRNSGFRRIAAAVRDSRMESKRTPLVSPRNGNVPVLIS